MTYPPATAGGTDCVQAQFLTLVSQSEMISGLDLLFLEVNSLEESLAFYERVLGMEVESVNINSRRCCDAVAEFTFLLASKT